MEKFAARVKAGEVPQETVSAIEGALEQQYVSEVLRLIEADLADPRSLFEAVEGLLRRGSFPGA